MISKRLIIIAVLAVAAGLVATAFLASGTKQVSLADKVALTADDLGPGWHGGIYGDPSLYPESVSYHYWEWHNDSLHLSLRIDVFNNTSECQVVFQRESARLSSDDAALNLTAIPLGDGGLYCDWHFSGSSDGYDYPTICFTRGNVLCLVYGFSIPPGAYPPPSWAHDSVIQIANLQAEKIDGYLA